MSTHHKKSAKHLAFDRERTKYNKKIKELESSLIEREQVISSQNESLLAVREEIRMLKDWVERLLEYTELSEEDMKRMIEKEKKEAEIVDNLQNAQKMFSRYFGI